MATDNVKVTMDVASRAAEIALKNFTSTTKKSDTAWSLFKANIGSAFALGGIKAITSSITDFGNKAINESKVFDAAMHRVQVSLKAAGITSKAAITDIINFSESMQDNTVYTATQVRDNISKMATLTDLSVEQLKSANQAAVDLAAGTGISLETAVDLVTKAVNGQTSSLTRYGLQVRKGANETENLSNVLDAFTKFQGLASKETETSLGIEKQMINAKDDLYAAIGSLLTQNSTYLTTQKQLTATYQFLIKFINENKQAIYDLGVAIIAGTAIVATATAGWYLYSAGLTSATAATALFSTAARAAWIAVTGPVGIVIASIVAISVGIYALIRNWDTVTMSTYKAIAATLEFSARITEIVSPAKAKGLREQADAFRAKATAIEEASKAAKDNIETENEAESNQVRRKKLTEDEIKLLDQLVARLTSQAQNLNALNVAKLSNLQMTAEQERLILQQQLDNQEIDFIAYQDRIREIELEYTNQRNENLLVQQQLEQDQLNIALQNRIINEEQYHLASNQLNENYKNERLKFANDQFKKELDLQRQAAVQEARFRQSRLSATASMFGSLADIAALGGEKMFKIMKAFNLAETITSGILSIQQAAASALPPFNVPAIAAASLRAAANVAKIIATQPKFAMGGIVGGSNFTGDKVPVRVNSGEMILNRQQQKNLFSMANNGGSSSRDIVVHTTVEVDGSAIAKAVSRQVYNGTQLGARI